VLFLAPVDVPAQTKAQTDAANRFRAQIGGSPIGTDLEVTLEGGERVEGELAEIETESFGLWVEPDEETKKKFRLTSGRVKKRMRYDRVVALRGAASAVAFSGEQLAFRMRVGDSVRIHTPEGDEVRGRVDEFDGDLLRVDMRSFHLSQGEVQRIEMKVQDSLTNGALIGLGVGVGWMGLVCAAGGECSGPAAAISALILGGGGAGLGALFDALHTGADVVYNAPGRAGTRLSQAPLFTAEKKRALVTLRF
jgi:hypothetical protein